MFVRKKRNSSGSTSVQILAKSGGLNKVVEIIGCSRVASEIDMLVTKAEHRILELNPQLSFDFKSTQDNLILNYLQSSHLPRPKISSVGIDLVLGKIFDRIGFNKIQHDLFRSIVLSRLSYPSSKLRTTEYLERHQGKIISVSSIYRFLDKYYKELKEEAEKIAYEHTKKVVGEIRVIFYDMTTLYFEAEQEDDFRKIGFSKDGKFQNPQIMLGLLVAEGGYPIGYDVYEGNKFEGETLIPILEGITLKYRLPKPIVIADSGLLSKENINTLTEKGYEFILGARIKNEKKEIKDKIIASNLKEGEYSEFPKSERCRLIVAHSAKRAKKDAYNRERGIKRLNKIISSGKLSKDKINSRGYNKFLSIDSEIAVSLNQNKIEEDKQWDGLKGYLTNTKLSADKILEHYRHLWQIEKAFRISKTDLRIRPIYHRKNTRIKAHISVAFVAYTIFKELERLLKEKKINLSPTKAIENLKTIYKIEFLLPDSLQTVVSYANLTEEQQKLMEI